MFWSRTRSVARFDPRRPSCDPIPSGAETRPLRRLPLALLLLAGQAATANAVAADPFGEGPFTVNFVGIAEPETVPIPTSPHGEFGFTDSMMTAVNATGDGLLNNLTGRCLGWWLVETEAQTFESHFRCTYTDDDGDEIFEKADFDTQPLGGPSVGTGHWMGGTGKYRELSGVFEIRTRSLRPSREGWIQYVGTKNGNYRLPEPAD